MRSTVSYQRDSIRGRVGGEGEGTINGSSPADIRAARSPRPTSYVMSFHEGISA